MARVRDGLFWDFVDARRPWRNVYGDSDRRYGPGRDEDFCIPSHAARMMRAVMVRWQATGGGSALEAADELCAGMRRIAIDKGDYQLLPREGRLGRADDLSALRLAEDRRGVGRDGGRRGVDDRLPRPPDVRRAHLAPPERSDRWRSTWPGGWRGTACSPGSGEALPDPDRDHAGAQGLGGHIAASLPDPAFIAGAEQGHWYSHFHARATVLRGLLEYARAAGDQRIWSSCAAATSSRWRRVSPASAGSTAIPAATQHHGRLRARRPGRARHPADRRRAGRLLGRRRRHRAQPSRRAAATSMPPRSQRVAAASAQNPPDTAQYPGMRSTRRVIERSLGHLLGPVASHAAPAADGPCSAAPGNGTQGLYYAWEAAVREDGDTAQVNLLLNRASALLDVDSCCRTRAGWSCGTRARAASR